MYVCLLIYTVHADILATHTHTWYRTPLWNSQDGEETSTYVTSHHNLNISDLIHHMASCVWSRCNVRWERPLEYHMTHKHSAHSECICDGGHVCGAFWPVRRALLEWRVWERRRSHGSGFSSGCVTARAREPDQQRDAVRNRTEGRREIGCQAAWFVSSLGSCQHNNLPAFLSFLLRVYTHTRIHTYSCRRVSHWKTIIYRSTDELNWVILWGL